VKADEDFVEGHEVYETLLGSILMHILFFVLLILWPTIFIGFYIKERECRSKLLQLISGANRIIYWISSFGFDYAIFILISFVLLGSAVVFQNSYFKSLNDFGFYFLIFAVYGFSTLPLLYLFSYLFTKHLTGESMALFLGFLCECCYMI
jgi:ATP-binding cassette subfamily A (ABC1) protein 3